MEQGIGSLTFENRQLTEQKSDSGTRAGLIYLNPKESQQNSNDTDSSPRQFYNQTRKKQPVKKDSPANQPQSITQSSRGLTNVTRTLYDPNAAATTPKPPPIVSTIQPTTTVKIISNSASSPQPQSPAPLMNPQQMQEFHQQ